MYYTIYQTTNQLNGRHYTSSHMTENMDDGYLGSGKALKAAIKRYGKQNFTKQIIFIAFDEASMALIEELLVETRDQNPMSYNMIPGGGRPPAGVNAGSFKPGMTPWTAGKTGWMSEEGRLSISKRNMGNQYPLGIKRSTETKQKVSLNRKGKAMGVNNAMANPLNRAKVGASKVGRVRQYQADGTYTYVRAV